LQAQLEHCNSRCSTQIFHVPAVLMPTAEEKSGPLQNKTSSTLNKEKLIFHIGPRTRT